MLANFVADGEADMSNIPVLPSVNSEHGFFRVNILLTQLIEKYYLHSSEFCRSDLASLESRA